MRKKPEDISLKFFLMSFLRNFKKKKQQTLIDFFENQNQNQNCSDALLWTCPEMLFPSWLLKTLGKQIPEKSTEGADPNPSVNPPAQLHLLYFPLCFKVLILSHTEWLQIFPLTNHFVIPFPSITLNVPPKFCP